MEIQFPTIHERIPHMSEEELEALATSEALAMADSSKIEGLVLDQDKIREELLAGYLKLKSDNSDQAS